MKIKMKMLRKFISVLCAVTMTTSCAVISASANGPEEYKQTRSKIERNIARLEELKKLAQKVGPQESSGEMTEIKKQNKIQNKMIKIDKLRNIRKNNPIQNLVDVKNDGNPQQKHSKMEEKIIKSQNLSSILKKNRLKVQNKIINVEKSRNANKNDRLKEEKGIIEKKIIMPNKTDNDKRALNVRFQEAENNRKVQPYAEYFIDFETQNHIKIQPRIDQEITFPNKNVDNRQVQPELQNRRVYKKKKINIPPARVERADNNCGSLGIFEMDINLRIRQHSELRPVDNRQVQPELQNRRVYKKKKINIPPARVERAGNNSNNNSKRKISIPYYEIENVEDRRIQQETQNRPIYKKKKLNIPSHDFSSVEDRQDKFIIEKRIVMPKKNSNNNNEKQLLQETFNNKCNNFIKKFNLFNQWKNVVMSIPVSQNGKIGISFEDPAELKFNQPRGIFFNNSKSKDLVQVKIPRKDPTQMINRQVVQRFSEIKNNLNSKNVEKFGKLVDKAIDKMSWFVQNFNKGLSTVDEAEELEESQSLDLESTDETLK